MARRDLEGSGRDAGIRPSVTGTDRENREIQGGASRGDTLGGRDGGEVENKKSEEEQTKVTVSPQPIETTKIQRVFNKLSKVAEKIKSVDNTKGFITTLSNALEAEVKGASRYANFTLSNGTTLSIRISNHNANANNYKEKGTARDVNISIVIKQKRRGNTFVGNKEIPLTEYSYLKNNLTGEDMSNIATSLAEALQTGEYIDKTGKAKINNSGTSESGVSTLFSISNENQRIFVSNAERAVEGIRQEKATPEQWIKMIEKNGGLKAEEDKWTGLSEWLKGQDKKTLAKQEVLDFINVYPLTLEQPTKSNKAWPI